MDLPENWEKKALIVVVAVFLILVIYAYNPFQTRPNTTIQNQNPQNGVPIPFPKANTSTNSSNNTLKLTAEQAKTIATQARPGYNAGQPIQGTVMVNNTNYAVWIVPLSQNNVVSKTLYIDANTGIIVLEI
jgi:hypothetical protein